MKAIALLAAALFVPSVSYAAAGNKTHLKAAIENSKICEPIKFDAKSAFALFGVALPDALKVVDTNIGWDKTLATVRGFSSGGGKISVDFDFLCAPSPEGAVIKALKLKPEDVAIKDQFTCKGSMKEGKVGDDLSCDARGEIGKILAKTGILKGRLRGVIDEAIAAK